MEAMPEITRASGSSRSLLELDPQLGQLLSDERRAAAEHELRLRVSAFPTGEWDGGRLVDADPSHLGLLVVDGVLAREVVLGDTVSTELLGPGDIIRPWHLDGPPELLPVIVRWNALSPIRLGLIDRRVASALGRYPEVSAVIVDRLSERAQRLAVTQAISQLNRVDRRLLALFWHLAERWGRVGRDRHRGPARALAPPHRRAGRRTPPDGLDRAGRARARRAALAPGRRHLAAHRRARLRPAGGRGGGHPPAAPSDAVARRVEFRASLHE